MLVAAVAAALWATFSFFDALAPNVVTEALGIAVTITAVEWIVRRESRDRLRPRTEGALYWMGLDFRMFVNNVLHDYVSTHLDSIRGIPRDAGALIALWIGEMDLEDAPRSVSESERYPGVQLPVIILSAIRFADSLESARARDLDVLEPDLVRAIDTFGWSVRAVSQTIELVKDGLLAEDEGHRGSMTTVMLGTKQFADVFRRHAPAWFTLLDADVQGWLAYREHLIRVSRPEAVEADAT